MAFWQTIADNPRDLRDRIRRLAIGDPLTSNPVFTGTGTGLLLGLAALTGAPAASWTLTASSATTFSVSDGSATVYADATVDVDYSNSAVKFKIASGGVAFAAGDKFTFSVSVNPLPAGERWTVLRETAGESILQGPGAGTDKIMVGIQDYANGWRLQGFSDFLSGSTFETQPGLITGGAHPRVPLPNLPLPAWVSVNSRRILAVVKADTAYMWLHLGWILPYGSPGQYPDPMFIGGQCAADYDYTTTPDAAFFNAGNNQSAWLRQPGGTWASVVFSVGAAGLISWPWNRLSNLGPALDGSVAMFPFLLVNNPSTGGDILGEVDGLGITASSGRSAEELFQTTPPGHGFWNGRATTANDYAVLMEL